jgi:small subunit ribosomal protein S6
VRPYELVIIFNPGLEGEEAYNAQIERVTSIIADNGGEVEKADKWGRRRLAYEIKGLTEGYYVVIRFNAPNSAGAEVERVLKITDTVVRHLLVRLDEDKVKISASAADNNEEADQVSIEEEKEDETPGDQDKE